MAARFFGFSHVMFDQFAGAAEIYSASAFSNGFGNPMQLRLRPDSKQIIKEYEFSNSRQCHDIGLNQPLMSNAIKRIAIASESIESRTVEISKHLDNNIRFKCGN